MATNDIKPDVVIETTDYIVYQYAGLGSSYYMYDRAGNKLGELIGGEKGLERSYKGDFDKWFKRLRKRALERFHKINTTKAELTAEQNKLCDIYWFSGQEKLNNE